MADVAETRADAAKSPERTETLEPTELTTEAMKIVRRYIGWSAAGGLLPAPGLDMAAVLAVQLKMLSEISDVYDVPFQRNLVKGLVSSLLGSFLPITVAQASGSALKVVPLFGTLMSFVWQPALASASTYALGKVFIQHFESGGTFLNFKPEEVREYFREQFEAARRGVTGRDRQPSERDAQQSERGAQQTERTADRTAAAAKP
jgi:uncharacterized protein (DUF697 family)